DGNDIADFSGNTQYTEIEGGNGNDRISGGLGTDYLSGGAGDDIIIDGGGYDVWYRHDSLYGGTGNDIFVVSDPSATIEEQPDEGLDTVHASSSYTLPDNVEYLVLTGSAAIDGTGNALANTITGNSAANRLDGGGGVDFLLGGAGDDVYVVDQAGDRAKELRADGGKDLVLASVSFILEAHVDNLTLTGSAAIDGGGNSDSNEIIGNSAANRIDGAGGADAMRGMGGDDTYIVDNARDWVVEAAGAGIDTVRSSVSWTLKDNIENLVLTGTGDIFGTGNALANVLTGNAGANTLSGAGGADTMAGGRGNDIYVVDDAGDTVVEAFNEGTDLVTSSVSWTLGANVESLALTGTANVDGTGNALANQIYGNSGANRLDGGAGIDFLSGGDGDDVYIVSDVGDRAVELRATGGHDRVESAVSFVLAANVEDLLLTGAGAISGTGNALANHIAGNAAANAIEGGLGADTLTGGGGNDRFVYRDAAHSTAANRDSITDFNAGDRIDLSGIDAGPSVSGNQPFTWIAAAAFSGHAGELRATVQGANRLVEGDVDGDGNADLTILVTVTDGHALTAADFVL
ncbi:MAG: calcium-binding protein, partial [Alphaproteobacteria bacterium]